MLIGLSLGNFILLVMPGGNSALRRADRGGELTIPYRQSYDWPMVSGTVYWHIISWIMAKLRALDLRHLKQDVTSKRSFRGERPYQRGVFKLRAELKLALGTS